MFDWALNTPLVFPGYVSYLGISMIMATLDSCDQVIFKISLYVLFQYVCVCFVNLQAKFRQIVHSCQNSEITCLIHSVSFRFIQEYFSVIVYSYVIFFSFQHKHHQSTNAYNCRGSGSIGRSGFSNLDGSFSYYDNNHVVAVI